MIINVDFLSIIVNGLDCECNLIYQCQLLTNSAIIEGYARKFITTEQIARYLKSISSIYRLVTQEKFRHQGWESVELKEPWLRQWLKSKEFGQVVVSQK